ncbi:MAG: NAD-dependent epimerase/dehydratase family protein [Treponema sp.]|nr:NAD-dependent epimerase/dehydratase family protein [Treponema sp.]
MELSKKTVIAVTGADGAMGGEVVSHLLKSSNNYELRLFMYDKARKVRPFFKKLLRQGKGRITLVYGDLANYDEVAQLIDGADYIIHCGAVIPPKADHNPDNTMATNYLGTKNIVDAIKNTGHQEKIKLVHISTVAVYGNRDYHHPWCRMGDPVMSSAYDYYSASKIKGERYVLESDLDNWVVLRQTAVFHKYFLANNMNDGLMFHTPWNAPFEWVTDVDSGLMIQNLVEKDEKGQLQGFWKKDYNIGGGKDCRETGYETFNSGFALMGAGAEKFFEPNWNIPRNFHGVWYTDSDVLDKWLDYRRETSADFWKRMEKQLWYYKLGAIVPAGLIKTFAIKRLLKNSNAPMQWVKLGKKGRIDAFFGGEEAVKKMATDWADFKVLAKGQTEEGPVDYQDLKDESKADRYKLSHGYDESKDDGQLDLEDLKAAAEFRGGEVLSQKMEKGNLYTKIQWKCHNGHVFESTPYTILKAGFWCPECCEALPWAYNKVAKSIPFYAQIWYDTQSKDEEDRVYPYSQDNDDDMLKPVEKL